MLSSPSINDKWPSVANTAKPATNEKRQLEIATTHEFTKAGSVLWQ